MEETKGWKRKKPTHFCRALDKGDKFAFGFHRMDLYVKNFNDE